MLFSLLKQADFLDRSGDLQALLSHVTAAAGGHAGSLVVTGRPGIGKTELLKQLFNRLFWKQQQMAPFFYSVNTALLSAQSFSRDYLAGFLSQALAFRRKEQALLASGGATLDALDRLAEERGESWARDVIDRFQELQADPVASLRLAINAPRLFALATGTPVVVLIDEFHRLAGLSCSGAVDPRLASLFEEQFAFGKTPHLVTGNSAEIQEMPVAAGLGRFALSPFTVDEAAWMVSSRLAGTEAAESAPPAELLLRLGGNPFYLSSLITRVSSKKKPDALEYWRAYAAEIMGGVLCSRWTAAFKGFFPDPASRGTALAAVFKLFHSAEPLTRGRLGKALSVPEDQAGAVLDGLYRAGFAHGELGVFRPLDDGVVQDVVECLHRREIRGESDRDLEQALLERAFERQPRPSRFEMTLPMEKDAELVVAHCIEQIGKNHRMNPDAVGQMQIAVIEACINAIEHSGGADRNIYLCIETGDTLMKASVESAGREFFADDTGEPHGAAAAQSGGRGWGIKLMKEFTDDVRFEKTVRGTKVVLTKKFAAAGESEKEKKTDRG